MRIQGVKNNGGNRDGVCFIVSAKNVACAELTSSGREITLSYFDEMTLYYDSQSYKVIDVRLTNLHRLSIKVHSCTGQTFWLYGVSIN